MLRRGREEQHNIHPEKQRGLTRFNHPMFFMFLGIALISLPLLLNPVPAYASAHQVQQSQAVKASTVQTQQRQARVALNPSSVQHIYDACDDAGLKRGTAGYMLCERELPGMCQNTTTPIAGCYAQESLSVRCQNPQSQDLEACMTQNSPYSDPHYVLPDKTFENVLGTDLTANLNNGNVNVNQNIPFFVITPTYATVDNQTIYNIWAVMVGIVDTAAVILLLLNGLSMIFSGTTFRQADAVELLPGILLALIVANSSMGFMHFFIGLNNTLSGGIYSWADDTLHRTLGGYGRTYIYPQNTYIITLLKGDVEHNAIAYYASKHLPPTIYQGTLITVPTVMNNSQMSLDVNELPKQPTKQIEQVGPGYVCKVPGVTDYGVLQTVIIDPAGGGATLVKNAFQAYHLQSDPQKYVAAHPHEILGYSIVIRYPCALDVAREEKYLPFYPNHINFSIDLFTFFTSGLDQSIVPMVINVLGAIIYAQMLVRLLLINFYIVIGPLGIGCWALPGKSGQRLTRMWLGGFISLVMVQFLQVVALIITQVMIGAYLGFFHQQLGKEINPDLLEQVLGIAMLWFTLLIPNLLGTAPMQMLVEAGQEMGQVASAAMAASMSSGQSVAQGLAGASGTIARFIR